MSKPYIAAIKSATFTLVEKHVLLQLLESLLYEGLVHYELVIEDCEQFIVAAKTGDGELVYYQFEGKRLFSFSRIHLSRTSSIFRFAYSEERSLTRDYQRCMIEILSYIKEKRANLKEFVIELQQTLLKDVVTKHAMLHTFCIEKDNVNYDELEGTIHQGHPYHPCYKSRLGFTLEDNNQYGPEGNQPFQLVWLAIKRDNLICSTVDALDLPQWYENELGTDLYHYFNEQLLKKGRMAQNYMFFPVHPWQWREKIIVQFMDAIKKQEIVFLGQLGDFYSAQQSIRTVRNVNHPDKAYVKLSLAIKNTSTIRNILPRHTKNGPIVSQKLAAIMESDNFLRDDCRFILLKEVIGMTYAHTNGIKQKGPEDEGSLGVIWRESLFSYLVKQEEAIPFTAITHLTREGVPFIARWVKENGRDNWVRRLLHVTLPPLLHLLFKYGVALEAHAQNLILIHRDGLPVRIAARDVSGGILMYTTDEVDPALPETNDTFAVKDVFHNAFFFIHLTELASFLLRYFALEEEKFWTFVVKEIKGYESLFPELEQQFKHFDLFTETVQVAQLTRRKLISSIQDNEDHDVPNVLAKIAHELQGGHSE